MNATPQVGTYGKAVHLRVNWVRPYELWYQTDTRQILPLCVARVEWKDK